MQKSVLKSKKITECVEDIFISYRKFENHEQIYEKGNKTIGE